MRMKIPIYGNLEALFTARDAIDIPAAWFADTA